MLWRKGFFIGFDFVPRLPADLLKIFFFLTDVQEPGRRISMTPSKFGSSFLRRGRTGSVRSTASQSTIGADSVTGRMSHAGSVTSVFRRLFSKDRGDRIDPQSPGVQDPSTPSGEFMSCSTYSAIFTLYWLLEKQDHLSWTPSSIHKV